MMRIFDNFKRNDSSLEWWVYIEDFNNNRIEPYNIFSHYSFMESLKNIKKQFLKDKKQFMASQGQNLDEWLKTYKDTVFAQNIKHEIMYYFWGKCEWEIILTSWPPYVEKEEIQKLSEKLAANEIKYRSVVNLSFGEKIDVANQICMNYGAFIDYLWDHLDLITTTKTKRRDSD